MTHADGTTEEGVPVQNGMVTLKDGESFTIKDLPAADIFYAAEEDGLNMNMFETPHAERLFMDSVGQEHEEEIALHGDTTKYEEPGSGADPSQNLHDWETRPYALNDTEKIVYTNTLKETNLNVNKTWSDYATNKHEGDPVTFVVKATVPNDNPNGEPLPYEVAALKNGSADREFTLNSGNAWHQLIEHLPAYAPGTSGANPKPIAYTVEEKTTFEGYTTTVSSYGQSDLENVDVFKYWPDGNANHQGQNAEHIKVKLKDKDGRFVKANLRNGEYYFASYVGEQEATELPLSTDTYTVRVKNVPAREYAGEGAEVQEVVHAPLTFVQVGQDEDANTTGLVLFERPNTDQRITNTSISGNTPPTTSFEYHKRIDALRDGVDNPDTSHDEGEDLTDLYRLYLDYKINSLQAAEGVDLLFVIDHSGSMNNNAWGGNASRAPTVQEVLNGSNGQNGIIGEFLNVNNKNRWAAVGFSGSEPLYNPIANAGENNSEVLSPGGTAYAWQSGASEISLPNYGPNKLTDYTAGFWRAEQFLLRDDVKNDGRKKVVLFISDGIPTLYIPCEGTLVGADKAEGSGYYPDWFGGCPEQTYGQFWNFVSDLTSEDTYDYTFGEDIEFFAVGFGDSIQAQAGQWLLRNMVAAAYGKDLEKEKDQAFVENHFIPVNDSSRNYDARAKLKEALEGILDMDETYSNMVVTDNLSKYVTIYGLNDDGSAPSDVLKRAGAKVTMSNPDDPANPFVLYKDGQMTDANNLAGGKTILQSVTYAPAVGQATQDSTGAVTATFSSDYEPLPGITYTLSFDVKTTPLAYATYANSGYDKISGVTIKGDEDTDFLGTDPANATSVGKDGFRSNSEASVTYKHNGEPEGGTYKHPVIQVSTRVVIAKVDQQGKPLQGAKFDLYKDGYDPKKSADENKKYLVRGGLESKVDEANNSTKDALIYKAGLQAGTYYLVETKAPDGFLKLEGPVKVVIAENNGATTVAASINGKAIGYPKLQKDPKTGEWHLVIDNSAGVELPNTGGPGTAPLYALGCLCVVGAAACLLRRRLVR